MLSFGMQKFKFIETKYEVESVSAKGLQIWPFIRFSLAAKYQSGINPIEPRGMGAGQITNLLKQFFYGFSNLFRGYDYLLFSDSSERIQMDGQWVDKSVDFICHTLPKSLILELPIPKHFNKSQIPSSHIASRLPLYLLELIYARLFLNFLKIEREEVIKNILIELNLKFDYRGLMKRKIAQYKIGCFLRWLYRPKAVFMQPAYTNIGLVKSFRERSIKVIEVQHGLISSSHEAYNVYKELDKSCFPEYFLSFGYREKAILSNGYYIDSLDKIVPVGHFYLDAIGSSLKKPKFVIPELTPPYTLAVSVTGQNLQEHEGAFIEFIKEVVLRLPYVCFFYIPRSKQSNIFNYSNLPKNLINCYGRNTYEIIKATSFHTTMFSTCAIEALALGTPNILVNINNFSKKHLYDILGDSKSTVFVDTVDEYIKAIETYKILTKEDVIRDNSDFLLPNYKQNIRNFIRQTIT